MAHRGTQSTLTARRLPPSRAVAVVAARAAAATATAAAAAPLIIAAAAGAVVRGAGVAARAAAAAAAPPGATTWNAGRRVSAPRQAPELRVLGIREQASQRQPSVVSSMPCAAPVRPFLICCFLASCSGGRAASAPALLGAPRAACTGPPLPSRPTPGGASAPRSRPGASAPLQDPPAPPPPR